MVRPLPCEIQRVHRVLRIGPVLRRSIAWANALASPDISESDTRPINSATWPSSQPHSTESSTEEPNLHWSPEAGCPLPRATRFDLTLEVGPRFIFGMRRM